MPATTRSPTPLSTGSRLPGDHRLIHLGGTVDNHAVGRNAGPRADQDDVAGAKLGQGNGLHPVAVDTLGVIREECGQGAQRALRLADRAHLLPVTEEHDRHQQRPAPTRNRDRRSPRNVVATLVMKAT